MIEKWYRLRFTNVWFFDLLFLLFWWWPYPLESLFRVCLDCASFLFLLSNFGSLRAFASRRWFIEALTSLSFGLIYFSLFLTKKRSWFLRTWFPPDCIFRWMDGLLWDCFIQSFHLGWLSLFLCLLLLFSLRWWRILYTVELGYQVNILHFMLQKCTFVADCYFLCATQSLKAEHWSIELYYFGEGLF